MSIEANVALLVMAMFVLWILMDDTEEFIGFVVCLAAASALLFGLGWFMYFLFKVLPAWWFA